MTTYNRELSNLSYTNKDFSQIYPELLDLARKLSYKWDPSISDESDPGVVLLKLAALMADKCNYNIDKNVLELFPASVTQLANARQIFEQCGYTMRYYSTATTQLTLKLSNEPDISDEDAQELCGDDPEITANDVIRNVAGEYTRKYTIPKFTMFSDVDNKTVYTITDDVTLLSTGGYVHVTAVQGAINQYTINGTSVITPNLLDSNNRLYFTDLHIPENGIFISNSDEDDKDQTWTPCDNLLIEELGTRCYKFGLTSDGSRCYVEFPTDASTLMGKGLQIHYVQTSGKEGNIGRRCISQFFTETTAKRSIASYNVDQDVSITADNVFVCNEAAVSNGKNPETIEEAYRNYKKVKNTFNTLVSTRDYENFLKTNKKVSNCVVCDRSSDLQSVYQVLESESTSDKLTTHVLTRDVEKALPRADGSGYETVLDSQDEMTAFDLRIYGLKYVDGFSEYKDFRTSFELIDDFQVQTSILRSTDTVKSIPHNYLEMDEDRIILLKNKYPIIAKLVSPHRLTLAQQGEILSKAKLDLYEVLNSQVIEFGQTIDYNLVYETLLKTDPRVSGVILQELTYETYALYLHEGKICSLRVDAESSEPKNEELKDLWKTFRADIYARCVLAGVSRLYVPDTTFVYSLANEHDLASDVFYEVDTVSTSVDIPIKLATTGTESQTEPLRDNEVITLTAPNLVADGGPYANYTQFITNIGIAADEKHKDYKDASDYDIVVPKDSDYVLKPHEYIIFFWRPEAGANYNYVKLTGRDPDTPTIITPSFNLTRQPNPDILSGESYEILDKYFLKFGDDGENHSDGLKLQIDFSTYYNTYPITLTDFLARFICGKRFNVDVNSIQKKKVNKIHLNNTDGTGANRFYWILNTKTVISDDEVVYRLFQDGTKEYILQEGEQLIYSNPTLTQLYILGSGTKIERDSTTGDWDCPALNSKMEFLQTGPRYFEDPTHSWFNLDVKAKNVKLYATEMLYYKLHKGYRLRCDVESLAGCVIKSDGLYDSSSNKLDLVDCTFSYLDDNLNEVSIPARHHETIAWNVTSSLNLNITPDKPQQLLSNQRLKLSDTVTVTGNDDTPKFIQANSTVARAGGTDLDVRLYDVFAEDYVSLQLYIHTLNTAQFREYDSASSLSSNVIERSGSNISLTNLHLPQGSYIIPVICKDVTGTVIVFRDVDEEGNPIPLRILGMTTNEINEDGKYYVEFISDGLATEYSFNLKQDNQQPGKQLSCTILTPVKYTPAKLTSKSTESDVNFIDSVAEKVAKIHRNFDHVRSIPDSQLVEYPLESASFMDTNHPLNRFTICEYTINENIFKSDILVVGRS